MQLIPVLDVRGGHVVRGIAGQRSRYRPITSCLTTSADPLEVARALKDTFGPHPLYLADLDGLEHARPDRPLHARLAAEGFELLLDCGVRSADEVHHVLATGATSVVIALETWTNASALRTVVASAGPDRLIFSLDLKAGQPLAGSGDWAGREPAAIAQDVIQAGICSLIVLDLAAVGVDGGVPTIPLCTDIRRAFPDVKLITGGGVRGPRDLEELATAGIDGVLVASALHDGRIRPEHATAFAAQDDSRSPAG